MTTHTTDPPPPDPTRTHPHPRPQPNNTHNRVRQPARVHDPRLGPPPRPRFGSRQPTITSGTKRRHRRGRHCRGWLKYFSQTPEQWARSARVDTATGEAFLGSATGGFRRWDGATLAALGVFGAAVVQERGGLGFGALGTAVPVEAAGEGRTDNGPRPAAAVRLFDCVQPAVELASVGAREQLRAALRSDELIFGNAGSEARAGADVLRPVGQAIRTYGRYRPGSARIFVGDGPVADICISCATTYPEGARPTRLRSSWIVTCRASSQECP